MAVPALEESGGWLSVGVLKGTAFREAGPGEVGGG